MCYSYFRYIKCNNSDACQNSDLLQVGWLSAKPTQSSITMKVALHLRWHTTEKIQNCKKKGGCLLSENKFKAQKDNKLRWLVSDIDFKLLHIGCPIALR